MSAKMPCSPVNEQRASPNILLRPTTLYCNNGSDESLRVANNMNKLGKPTVLLSSMTPSPGNVTRIPICKPKSLTPSPGMLRRSASLRLRGDRLLSPSNTGGGMLSNGVVTNSGFGGRHDGGSLHRSGHHLGSSQGSVNAGPGALRTPNTDHSPGFRGGPSAPRKSPGATRSPSKEVKGQVQTTSPNRHRSLSLSLSSQTLSPHTPPVSPDRGFDQDDEDDLDSLHSYASMASTASCDHAYVARNGTTFSGRKMKYVVHCSSHAGQTGDEYLTPTQRAQKHIRRLKALLHQAKIDLEQKDSDIFRLTKEVVELRLYKASLSSPDEKSTSSDAITVRENSPESPPPPPPVPLEMQSSCADSGHFEDLASTSPYHRDKACATEQDIDDRNEDRRKLIEFYENKLQELTRIHGDETQELKRQHNDRVEALLKTLSDVNERYCQLMPDYETARERIRELEKELDDVSTELKNSEEKQRKMYLQMYAEQKDVTDHVGDPTTSSALTRVSVSDLLQQLQVTQIELENIKAMYRRLVEARGSKSDLDPEVTLQFLKSAIYYFLTDKENHRGHLKAIESILGFSTAEIVNIDKANTS